MSANNGIYILKTKDQYRVAHLQAIDNLTWSFIDGDWSNNDNTKGRLVPTRVVEMFGAYKYTRDELKAYKIAHEWASKIPILEYGVNVITYNKTWKHIVMDAMDYAKKEIDYADKNNIYLPKKQILEQIISGRFLDVSCNNEDNKMIHDFCNNNNMTFYKKNGIYYLGQKEAGSLIFDSYNAAITYIKSKYKENANE